MNVPMAKHAVAVPRLTTGSSRIESGRNGSSAVATRRANRRPRAAVAASRLRIGTEAQG
jgi:hypothetical protein